MSSQTNHRTEAENPLPPYSVPVSVSLLISGSLDSNPYSPASSLIIPFIRQNIPFGYAIIVMLDFFTALLVKWAYAPYGYSMLPGTWRTAVPRMSDLIGIYGRADEESSPLLPVSGININLSISSPFSSQNSRAATLYTIELKQIRNIPGYLVPLASLILFFILKQYYKKSG